MELLINQFYTFVIMFIFGIVMGVFFNIYQHIANNIRNRMLVNTMDILMGVLAAIAAFCVLLYVNWGLFRFYILIAIFGGIVCYFKVIKKLHPEE